jgi:hypothetical protein
MRLAFFTVENGILYRRNNYKSRFARSRTRYRVPTPPASPFMAFFLVVIFVVFFLCIDKESKRRRQVTGRREVGWIERSL